MIARKMILTKLIEGSIPPTVAEAELKKFSWDSEVTEVILTRVHLRHILSLYLADRVSAVQLESWANAIEGREDIGFEAGYEDRLNEAIHQLANPLLTSPITVETITELKHRICL